MPFTLDKTITVGELMTVLSIMVSAISVVVTWNSEQNIQVRENATRTRVEIAKTWNKVNQVIQIQLSFYELLDEDIVEASRIAVVEKEPIKARDYMWEKCFKHRAEIMNIISQNDWEVAYTNLLTYGIPADSLYIKTVKKLKAVQEHQYTFMAKAFRFEFESQADKSKAYSATTLLIDQLRELKKEYQEDHQEYSKSASQDLYNFCLEQIKETDKTLLFNDTK